MTLVTSWTPLGTPADPNLPTSVPAHGTPRSASEQTPTTAAAEPLAAPTRIPAAPLPSAPLSTADVREVLSPAAPTHRSSPVAPLAPEDPTIVPSAGTRAGSRSQRRAAARAVAAERRRAGLRSALKFGGPVLLVLALVLGAIAVLGGAGGPAAPEGAAGRTQSTLLLQVTGDSGLAASTVLLGRDLEGGGVTGLLIPARLLTQAPGAGSVSVAETGRLADPSVAGDAVSDQLGVIVDGVWRVSREGFAGMVDAVGGIEVVVDAEVVGPQGAILLNPGPQRLDGASAATYATYLAAGEQDASRSARFADVLTALLAAAPADAAGIGAIVAGSGGAGAPVDSVAVAEFLVPLAVAARGDGLGLSSLPVKLIDTGASEVSYRLDLDASAEVVSSRFSGSLPPSTTAGGASVLVQNGVGTPGLGQVARDKLIAAGMVYVSGGNATSFGRQKSAVVIPDATGESRRLGLEVARALGLPDDAVRLADRGQSVADVVVVLGSDFVAS